MKRILMFWMAAAFCFSALPVSAQQPLQPKKWRKPFKLAPIDQVQFEQEVSGFFARDDNAGGAVPNPISMNLSSEEIHGKHFLDENAPKDEFLVDGADRNHRAYVNDDWKVFGLDTEDTIGHFDTLDGRRIATPSNRVHIYAPRFASVRRVSKLTDNKYTLRASAASDRIKSSTVQMDDEIWSTKQNLQPNRHKSTMQPFAFVDQTRGMLAESVEYIGGLKNGYKAYNNLSFIKFGVFETQEGARLNVGLQSASAWTDNLRALVNKQETKIIKITNVAAAQDLTISEENGNNPTLKVAKVASRITAKSGDEVEFTIRFDNVGNQTIGNVTIIDNLTTRLEYIDGSSESSLKGRFVSEPNEGDSLILRWEIDEPLEVGKGGVITFKCRVR